MSNTIYNKLVRDGVPEILKDKAIQFKVEYLPTQEAMPFIINKFLEQLREVVDEMVEVDSDALKEELADMMTILFKFGDLYDIKPADIIESERLKTEYKGAFSDNCILRYVIDEDEYDTSDDIEDLEE